MAQNTTPVQVTPWSGNPVITGYIVSFIVWGIVFLGRRYGYEVDAANQNILTKLIMEPVAEVVAFIITAIIALYTRARATSELTLAAKAGE